MAIADLRYKTAIIYCLDVEKTDLDLTNPKR